MNLRRFYPLDGFPQQRQLWSWISYDVANQSFTLIVNTLLFPIFFAQIVVQNPAIDDRLWSIVFGSSMLLTAILSPIAGAAADERGWKKRCLIGSGFVCAAFTCALAIIQPGQLWLAALLYIPANFAFSIGENFLASFLPTLGRQDQIGRVSGFSWACAYAAALLLLVLTAGAMMLGGMQAPTDWRPFFVFSGLWFFAFMLPTMRWLDEPAVPRPVQHSSNLLTVGFVRLADSVRHAAQFRDLAMLLVASLFYGTGMSVVVFFASKLADEYGFSQVSLVLFVAVITVSGIFGTIIPTLLQDRIGHRRSTVILLGVWIFAALAFALYAHLHDSHSSVPGAAPYPTWPLWAIGNLLGFGRGSLGSANRAFVGYLAPASRAAEIFGLWGLMFKLAAIMTFPFAVMKDTVGTPQALLLLAGFMVIGLVLTLFIDEKRGHAAAQEGDTVPV